MHTLRLVVLGSLLALSLSSSIFNRVVLPANGDAKCLDGSPGAYYISEGQGVNRTKFVLFFEGGGWCGSDTLSNTLESCYQRSKTDLGSSKKYPNTINAATWGMLSGDRGLNPGFYDWTRVFFKYCDGTGHQGTRSVPIAYKGVDLYFRGNNITMGQLAAVNLTHRVFTDATHIMVSGCSAGGLAAFSWTNYIAANAKGVVWSVPDSGIFLDVINVNTNNFEYREQFINFMKLSNIEIDPPTKECAAAYPTQKWKCMFAENLFEFITVPLFPLNSLYDSWSIPNIVGLNCISGDGSLSRCNQTERQILQNYRQNTSGVLNSITSHNINGAWAPSCARHCFTQAVDWGSATLRVPVHSQFSAEYSVLSWTLDSKRDLNNVHVDEDSWPSNDACAGQISQA